MRRINNYLFTIALTAISVLYSCTKGNSDLTGTSEQGNAKISTCIYSSDGTPASNAIVRLRPSEYISNSLSDSNYSGTVANTITDSKGSLSIDSLADGTYNLEINNTKSEALLITFSINSLSGSTILRNDTLKPFATITGKIDNPENFSKIAVKIIGLERSITPDSTGVYHIDNLPQSTYTLQIERTDTIVPPISITGINAQSGTTTTIPDASWHYYMRVKLNTTASGAALDKPVYNYPVLIRLTSSNFDFTQSTSDGHDIWFIKPDYTIVPYEIERWDSTANKAEIWLRFDTILPDDSTQYYIMHWGDRLSSIPRPEKAVFDTSAGYQGVWHLGETTTGEAVDATANRSDGTRVSVASAEGVIGNGQQFDGSSAYITMKTSVDGALNFQEKSTWSISAWVNAGNISDEQVILGKGSTQYHLKISGKKWLLGEFRSETYSSISSEAAADSWYYLCGISNNGVFSLYINGTIVSSTASEQDTSVQRDESLAFTIGKQFSAGSISSFCYFTGIIDEVRVLNKALNPEDVQLNYINEHSGNTLVQFRKL